MVIKVAVANLASLSEYCIPFVKKGGFFIPYKSAHILICQDMDMFFDPRVRPVSDPR